MLFGDQLLMVCTIGGRTPYSQYGCFCTGGLMIHRKYLNFRKCHSTVNVCPGHCRTIQVEQKKKEDNLTV